MSSLFPPVANTPLRTLLMAALSWLGLAQCVSAQRRPTDGAIDRAAIEAVLQRLDAAFARSDLDGYLAMFEPDHAGTHALLGRRLQRVFGSGHPLRRTSTILGEPRRVGPRTVVRVRSEIRSAAEAGERQIAVEVEDTIFAFRSDADGDHGSGGGVRSGGCPAPVPTFAIDTPRSPDWPSRAVFRCPPCNYEIGGVAGWLCVPMGRDHAQALEASSFFLLGTDLACDVSVRIDPTPLGEECKPATVNAEEPAFAMRQFEPEARTGIAAHWLPSSVAEHPPQGLDGARIRIDLPATDSAPDGNVALFHILQFGTLQHLLLVRGSKAALQDHRAQLDALLDSFRLLQTDLDRSTAAAAPLRHHLGGALDGTSYENITYDVRMTGPEDWQPQQRCGGAAFRIKWTSPAGGFLWLNGYSVPPGMVSWCRDTADRWLHQLCDAAGLALPCQLADWGESTSCEALARTIECRAERELPGARSKRLLHVAFRDDILVIADGSGTTDGEWTAIEHAIATLRL